MKIPTFLLCRLFPREIRISLDQQTALSAWGGRLLTAVVQLFAVRVVLGQLGTNQYAAWAVMVSLTAWFLVADFGISQAAQNIVARVRAGEQSDAAAVIVSVRSVWGVGGGIALVLVLLSGWIGDALLGNILHDAAQRQACVIITVVSLLFSSWATVATKIWYAQDHGIRANVLPAVAAMVSLLAVLIFPPLFPPSIQLEISLLAWMLPTGINGVGSLLWIYYKAAATKPAIRSFSSRSLWERALPYWSYAIMGIITLNSDYIILSAAISPAELVAYNLMSKLFSFLFFFYTSTLAIMSPGVSAANVRGTLADKYGVLRRHMVISSVAYLLIAFLLYVVLPQVLRALFGIHPKEVSDSLFLMIAIVYLTRIWCDGYAMFLGAIDKFTGLAKFLVVQMIICLPMEYVLARKFGSVGLVLGLWASYLFTVAWGLPYMTGKVLRQAAA